VRHGVAEDVGPDGTDASRRLSEEGRRSFGRAARGLARLEPALEGIRTSPLVRARETAGLLADALGAPGPEVWPLLAPGGDLEELLDGVSDLAGPVALVGHEPGLGHLLSLCVAGRPGDTTPLRKGGVARLRFRGDVRPGEGRLVYLLTPRVLRGLG